MVDSYKGGSWVLVDFTVVESPYDPVPGNAAFVFPTVRTENEQMWITQTHAL